MDKIKRRDILGALNRISFLERADNLSKSYRNSFPEAMPCIDKKKVNEIIRKHGYAPGYTGGYFRLKDQIYENVSFEVLFKLKYASVEIWWSVYEDGEYIYGNPWLGFKRDLLNDRTCIYSMPSFGSYEELEEILIEMFNMYEELKSVLLDGRGIDIHEN